MLPLRRCWNGAELDQQAKHVGLREALDYLIALEVKDGDAG